MLCVPSVWSCQQIDDELIVDKQAHAVVGRRRECPFARRVHENPTRPAHGKSFAGTPSPGEPALQLKSITTSSRAKIGMPCKLGFAKYSPRHAPVDCADASLQ